MQIYNKQFVLKEMELKIKKEKKSGNKSDAPQMYK